MKNITFEIVNNGDIEQCRILCDELMAFQKSKAFMLPEVFDSMNFDSRMKQSYANALASQVVVVKDSGTPVGYVFSTVETVKNDKNAYPAWVPRENSESCQGFYPAWDKLPQKIGCLNNLYFRESYRGLGLGGKLFTMSMEWLESFTDIELIFIYISNGNDAALDFYLKRGFTFSQDVFGGFIKAVYKLKS